MEHTEEIQHRFSCRSIAPVRVLSDCAEDDFQRFFMVAAAGEGQAIGNEAVKIILIDSSLEFLDI